MILLSNEDNTPNCASLETCLATRRKILGTNEGIADTDAKIADNVSLSTTFSKMKKGRNVFAFSAT